MSTRFTLPNYTSIYIFLHTPHQLGCLNLVLPEDYGKFRRIYVQIVPFAAMSVIGVAYNGGVIHRADYEAERTRYVSEAKRHPHPTMNRDGQKLVQASNGATNMPIMIGRCLNLVLALSQACSRINGVIRR